MSQGVVQYNLATPWFQVLQSLRAQFPADNVIHAMNFDDDGTRMYVSAGNFIGFHCLSKNLKLPLLHTLELIIILVRGGKLRAVGRSLFIRWFKILYDNWWGWCR